MPKVKVFQASEGGRIALFHCPGCDYGHSFKLDTPQENGAIWKWNGNVEKPTFSPSLLVFETNPDVRCHSFVRDGKIQFLGDCGHKLKNQTVELPEYDAQ